MCFHGADLFIHIENQRDYDSRENSCDNSIRTQGYNIVMINRSHLITNNYTF